MKIVSKPIKAIAVFEYDDGTPMPYKFKIMEDSEEEITVQVNKIFGHERKRIAGIESIIYKCQSVFGNIERIYELKYMVSECRWVLYNI